MTTTTPPPDIIEAAWKVQCWAEAQCAKPGQWWAVGGVQSRGRGTRVEAALMAAHRLLCGYAYQDWANASGSHGCSHGIARMMKCKACDRALVEAVVGELG